MTAPLMEHSARAPLTVHAISCVTGWPMPAALCTDGNGCDRSRLNTDGPNPRTNALPSPYAAQYTRLIVSVPMLLPPMNMPYECGWLFNSMNFGSRNVALIV